MKAIRQQLLTLGLLLSVGLSVAYGGEYYTHGSFPATQSSATSAGMRAELDLISAGFDKLPALSGNGSKAVIVNGAGTALTVTTGTLTLPGNFALSGSSAVTLTSTGTTNITLPTTGTLSTLAGSESLSNKTIPAPVLSGTVTGTYTLGGTPTITSPTINGATITGTLTWTPTITGHLLFTDALYDIGASGSTRPRDFFLSRNAVIGGTTSFGGNIVSNLLFTDATYDIGASGATRPRDFFLSRNATIGGTLGVTGNATLSGTGNNVGTVTTGVWNGTPLLGTYLAPRSYLAGLAMSTAGASATMTIAAGYAVDSTNIKGLTLASALNKTTGAWVVGNAQGGLDTGAIANSTWYHFWLIMRSDTGVVDVLISTSASAPTMPTNYDYRRRIGSGRTDGAAQWVLFSQVGDEFLWSVTVEDVDATPNSADAQTVTLTVPTGVKVLAIFRGYVNDPTSNNRSLLFSSLDESNQAPAGGASPGVSLNTPVAAAGQNAGEFSIRTNTSAQIRYRFDAADADLRVAIETYGWVDRRGRED